MSYLLLPRLKIQSANALACGFIVNASPVMAITQFVHNLVVRHLECEVGGVAILHHHAEHQALEDIAYDVLPHQRRSALLINEQDYVGKGSQGPTLSTQPTASCNLELSLLIEFEGLPEQEIVERFLHKARLAGGQITSYQELVFTDEIEDVERFIGKSGFWLIERPELIDAKDPLGSVFSSLERTAISSKQAAQLKQQEPQLTNQPLHEISHAWIVPTVLGYQAVTDFAAREGVRMKTQEGSLDTTLHAYAEPLIGIVQYVPARDWEEDIPFWHQHWLDAKTFVVQCHSTTDD